MARLFHFKISSAAIILSVVMQANLFSAKAHYYALAEIMLKNLPKLLLMNFPYYG